MTSAERSDGLLPVSEWPKAAQTDDFYRVMFEGCFRDAEDLARFLLRFEPYRERLLEREGPE